MDLVVVRHAIAGDREEWSRTGRPDAERPVTPEGRKRMQDNARGLRSLASGLQVLATSPYTRAVQTAEILAVEYPDIEVVEVPALAHGEPPEAVRDWLGGRSERRIAVVGHEPDLGRLISWFVLGTSEPAIALKKGGAALVRFAGAPDGGTGELRWLAPPKLLRGLGR